MKLHAMQFARIMVPAAPVRRKPDHRREMVNQLLFGEAVRILKKRGEGWLKVRSLHDGYAGWITASLIRECGKRDALEAAGCVTTGLLSEVDWGDAVQQVPAGSVLPGFSDGKGQLAGKPYQFAGPFMKRADVQPSAELVGQLTRGWLNAPYLWGGRTILGVDCSGFAQVMFRIMGIDLPRDAWQQAKKGVPVKKFSEARPGDLLFFDNTEDIVHVGILLGEEQMIHASGMVRIDTVTRKGMINEAGKNVYGLSCIRRFW